MLKLKALSTVSNIGIICPASCEDKDSIDYKISEFKKLGFSIIKGKHIYNSYGYLSDTDKARADDLNDMFINSNIDAIVCLRGGYGSIRMAPYLDLKSIANNPKIFCGYSDITLLLNYINKICNFVTFHSPMITSDFNNSFTKESFINILSAKDEFISYNLENICGDNYYIYNNRNFSGKLIGGNLSIICSTIATPYEIDFNNSILLLEEVNESPYVIDRMLSQLVSSGRLKNCSAILLGHFTNCTSSNPKDFNIDQIIEQILLPLNIPIIKNFPVGHSYPNLTLPIGGYFSFSSYDNTLKLVEKIF